ncbi:Hypothetical protein LOCK900_2054 [Lacticaseibacillus rhamnosus LOCK900]|nr:Hypothetical protein LOCK900_2054 [Lacticaseibacillus rhamnosus LOCK900]EHJ27196.1 hypothetical protein HMPREF0541_02599 [Lacticaseibacillus rhamnosus ATCC 21052]
MISKKASANVCTNDIWLMLFYLLAQISFLNGGDMVDIRVLSTDIDKFSFKSRL